MNQEPFIGIILVNYNNYNDTAECIQSIQEISYNNYHIWVINNYSSDKSGQRLQEKYPNITVISTNENLGFAGANNYGIEKALSLGAEYLLLLNNDTVVEKDFLTELVSTAEESKDTGIIGGRIHNYNQTQEIWYAGGTLQTWIGRTTHIRKKRKGIHETTFITGCLMLIDSNVINQIGGLNDKYFMYYEDVEYCMRYLQAGGKMRVNCDSKIRHKEGASSREDQVASPLRAYYDTRNRLIFSREDLNYPRNIIALAFNLITRTYVLLRWLWFGGWDVFTAGIRGIKDGIMCRKGKHPKYPED